MARLRSQRYYLWCFTPGGGCYGSLTRGYFRPAPPGPSLCRAVRGHKWDGKTHPSLPPVLWFLLQMAVDKKVVKGAKDQRRAAKPHGDVTQLPGHQIRVLAGFHTDVTEHAAPDGRADDGKDGELQIVHFSDAGGNTDKLPRPRQQPRHKHAHGAVVRHPALCRFQFLRREEDEFSIAQHQRPAGLARQPIHNSRSQPGAEDGHGNDAAAIQRQLVGVRPVGGGRDDGLARDGQEAALPQHEQQDGGIAERLERAEIPGQDGA
jgi:hypothetical protein